ncbi:hypothetical protein OF829_10310 [Sphingomonas sp. LB-2]|uniref:hypothetical protein n=1 Tax=Sphingomonas caeni TaxID=2984949 RepID=UPI00223086B7|nr:hypothetical protein [Sphingomonas caeni]MCW3847636.1 hypothetical protein [Sphingomonas caeni]
MADYVWALLGAAIGATILSRGLLRGALVWGDRAVTRARQPGAYWIVMVLAGILIVHGAWYLARGWG